MTSTDKSDLSSGFLRCALYILLMGAVQEALNHLPVSSVPWLKPWLLAAPHVVAAVVCLRAFRAAGAPVLWRGTKTETIVMRGAVILLSAAGLCGIQALLALPAPSGQAKANPAAWIFAACIAGPAAEELFFRGMLFSRTRAAIRIPAAAVLFGLAHLQLEQGIFALAGGLVFGWIAFEFGLVAAILCHGVTNFFALSVVLSREPLPIHLSVLFVLAAALSFVYVKARK